MTEQNIPKIGESALNFCLPNEDGNEVCLDKYKGKWVVLYFYMKDNSKSCTIQAVDFSANFNEFTEMDAQIIGISPDSSKSHKNFIGKNYLKIELLSDPENTVAKNYGLWQTKKMYGKEYMGVIRSTFIIDPKGIIKAVWANVKVNGHAEEVRDKLKELKNN
ncbi:MAG: putative peroxiredoxin [Candidatus Methanofastidiosum methylothiophilum]|uniref:thioredoxin-dependent peroxiredoxin n=1 Tax=Candidatus Methanofastidiosum methylothiophilum TaxID=1705564 RepID=A0A150IKG8_9EURY|nr:MAG: putative peroxiredoxin [Candidatus Methanofastidiosum methylthiophilus]KYC47664.1 MAG: putative peroxiredoxin [Candidatus Methanofastidiosum methylthiophilus]KYC50125.1 MAG: putative peroxiredoxin [Candidatus Methanofastidiosum methylthiophilus]